MKEPNVGGLLDEGDRRIDHVYAATGTLPNFLVIGAQRCGTTSIARHLQAHPDVFVAPQKEVHFFDRFSDRGIEWYKTQFDGHSQEQAVGEATPEYMYLPHVPAEMAQIVPDARLMAVLRNPIERAYSEYKFVRGRGYEELSFDAAVDAEAQRLASGVGGDRTRYAYVDRGRYLVQLRRVCEHFPRERLMVVLFEDFVSDPVEVMRSVYRFLEVDPDFTPKKADKQFGQSHAYRSLRLKAVARRLPYPLGGLVTRLNTRDSSDEPMSRRTRVKLEELFEEEISELETWLARDLSLWNRREDRS